MTNEEAIKKLEWALKNNTIYDENEALEYILAVKKGIEALEQEPCEDCISRKSIKYKLQEHHDFFVNAYGGFSNLPQNDKSRVDEITNCIAMVVNEPPVTPKPKTDVLDKIRAEIELNRNEWIKGKDAEWHTYDRCLFIIDKYKAEKE